MAKLADMTDLRDLYETEYDPREFKRGEVYYVDLEDIGYTSKHISNKTRPGLIIQNNKGNEMGHTLIVALLTTSDKKIYPFQYHVTLNNRKSIIMCEQIMTIDKYRVLEKLGELTPQQMREADKVLMYSLQLNKLSLENVSDISVVSVVTKKIKSTSKKYQEKIYFEINIFFTNNQIEPIKIELETLQKFNPSITKDTDFDELKTMLDCCKGLSFLVNNNES